MLVIPIEFKIPIKNKLFSKSCGDKIIVMNGYKLPRLRISAKPPKIERKMAKIYNFFLRGMR
jgi:hypothetical protein